ncbi:hypothetical protein BSL82_16055 [Tardibacter chloracetimidivorans]|uniref:LytR/CpsA/Psr regulator C-terminal domain-containing protein n=1 Tax=Tardibacter chloracetimidivorans TaxID=1921510 RepID=A0A1L3ZYA4_9SPHN|nr:LytR C-terminal domain-containing protein [Tardibacter chloracetimidivorans]API60614.1 hypothetical protein BSL82_16055 [Tardibacter chloracetimidivorans]
MRIQPVLLAAVTVAGCSSAQMPSNVRWSGQTPDAATADASYHYSRGKAQLAAGNASLALDGFRKALRLNPKSIDALNGLGAAYDRMGRFDLSRNYYERALGLDPDSRMTLNNFGYSLALQGKRVEAQAMLARAEQGAEDTVAGIAARNLAALTPSAGERAQARPAERATTRSSWVERLSVNTQLLVTRLAHIARRPEITSVTRPAAESASERPARYSPEYHRQRIYVDAATLAEMANDEVMLSTGTATSLVVLNGVGRRGMAARFAGFLSVNGYSNTDVGDTLPTKETELLYPVEQSAVAKAIAAQLPFEVRLTPSPKVQSITLAIGQDAARFDDHLRRVQVSA